MLALQLEGEYTEEMSDGARQRLRELFAPHNKRLFKYLGRTFDWQ